MIDDRINKTLSELEANLTKVDSARKQVESTVASFSGLKSTTASYVESLSKVNENLRNLISLVGKDYSEKTIKFDEDRKSIVDSCNLTIEAINNTSEDIKNSVANTIDILQKKMNYTLIANAVILLAMIILFFLGK